MSNSLDANGSAPDAASAATPGKTLAPGQAAAHDQADAPGHVSTPLPFNQAQLAALRPATQPLFARRTWWLIVLAASLAFVLPLCNLVFAPGHALHVPGYLVALLGKFLCYALAALALDLVWGYTGILSLGHGVFFALGAYAHGMYLVRAATPAGALPEFMQFLDWKAWPWYWNFTEHFAWCLLLVLLVPGLLAWVFGYFAFRSRIKGVYFSIITQALTYAAMLLFFRNNTGFGGNNGFTAFQTILGFPVSAASTRAVLVWLSLLALLGSLLLCRALVQSKLGRVLQAVRDGEARLMFIGYEPLHFKLFVWTLSAVLCSIAGALYVPQVGIINPSEMSPGNSIEMVIWVAVGGRGTLLGPILGAFGVNGLKSWFTASFPDLWLFALGLLFILVTLFMQRGLMGLLQTQALTDWLAKLRTGTSKHPAATHEVAP